MGNTSAMRMAERIISLTKHSWKIRKTSNNNKRYYEQTTHRRANSKG